MKIAIIHDSLLHIGGAEKVFFELIKIYPQADIFISIAKKDLLENNLLGNSNRKIKVSLLSNLPFVGNYASFLKPLIFLYWEKINFKQYDLIISSSHSFSSKSVNTDNKTLHLSYIHTPPRYLYLKQNKLKFIHNPLIKFLTSPFINILKKKDIEGSKKPDLLIANSKNVKNRIKKYYRRNSLVIYPPIKIPSLVFPNQRDDYFVCFSRLVNQKGINLAINACNKLKVKLIIIGDGPERKKLEKMAGPTIQFTGFVSDKEVSKILYKSMALINCSIDEDFGMVTVESLAHGTPVIGYNSGALKEIIINKKTGVIFNDFSVESLTKAINIFNKKKFSSTVCHQHSIKFSQNIFENKIKKVVKYYQ